MQRIFSWALAVRLCLLIASAFAIVSLGATAPARADTYQADCGNSCPGGVAPTGPSACGMAIATSGILYGSNTCFQSCTIGAPTNGAYANFFGGSCPSTYPYRDGYSAWIGCSSFYLFLTGEGCVDPKPKPPCDCNKTGPVIVADPIGALTGQLFDHSVDYESAGPFPLRFTRDYTTNPRATMFSLSMFSVGHYGATGVWQSNFEAQLYNSANSSYTYPPVLMVSLPGNRHFAFQDTVFNGPGPLSACQFRAGPE